MGLFDAAKDFVTNPDNIAKAKELATDENIDKAAGKLRELAPEQARGAIDGLADKAKEWGGNEGAEAPQAGNPDGAENRAENRAESGERGQAEGRQENHGEARDENRREGRNEGHGEGRNEPGDRAGRDN